MNMNLRHIRIYTKNAIFIVLSMIVMAGVTGFSYKAHYCHGSLAGIAFYTELGVQKAASCGCKDDANTGKAPFAGNTVILKKKACCSDISFFSKLNIESPVNAFSSLALVHPALNAVIFSFTCQAATENVNIPFFDSGSPPPLLSGRELVLFLSQQRIPLICYNC